MGNRRNWFKKNKNFSHLYRPVLLVGWIALKTFTRRTKERTNKKFFVALFFLAIQKKRLRNPSESHQGPFSFFLSSLQFGQHYFGSSTFDLWCWFDSIFGCYLFYLFVLFCFISIYNHHLLNRIKSSIQKKTNQLLCKSLSISHHSIHFHFKSS